MFSVTFALSLLCVVLASDIIDDRIVGGSPAYIINYPYQISFQSDGSHFCGGSLIRTDVVLTAAHCVEYAKSQPISSLKVRAGSRNYNFGGALRAVKAMRTHQNYNSNTMVYDVAVVKLASPFKLTQYIDTIQLATQTPANGTKVTISGWGTMNSGATTIPLILQAAEVDLIRKMYCATDYSYAVGDILDTMICAGATGKDTCQGDSGGPLVNKATGVLLGVVSWGDGCALQRYPGVYASVAMLNNWITTNAGTI